MKKQTTKPEKIKKVKVSPPTRADKFEVAAIKELEKYPSLYEEYEVVLGSGTSDLLCEAHEVLEEIIKHNPKVRNAFVLNLMHKACEMSLDNGKSIITNLKSELYDQYTINSGGGNQTIIQQYFKDVKTEYDREGMDGEIEYIQENRDKLIRQNLKSVIAIAKSYQGLGIPLEDLISAGNEGLCLAWDKFDPSRNMIQATLFDTLDDITGDSFTIEYFISELPENTLYGKLEAAIREHFTEGKMYTRNYINKWIINNVRAAKFSSVAMFWIKAKIRDEIDANSRMVRKPKSEIYKDKLETGKYKREFTIDIEGGNNESDEGGKSLLDILGTDDTVYMETEDSYNTFKYTLDKLFTGIKARDRRIFLKKFGIGLPRPMTPKEISESENLSIARVSQISQYIITTIRERIEENPDEFGEKTLTEIVSNLS